MCWTIISTGAVPYMNILYVTHSGKGIIGVITVFVKDRFTLSDSEWPRESLIRFIADQKSPCHPITHFSLFIVNNRSSPLHASRDYFQHWHQVVPSHRDLSVYVLRIKTYAVTFITPTQLFSWFQSDVFMLSRFSESRWKHLNIIIWFTPN